jgi:hypothetical protein
MQNLIAGVAATEKSPKRDARLAYCLSESGHVSLLGAQFNFNWLRVITGIVSAFLSAAHIVYYWQYKRRHTKQGVAPNEEKVSFKLDRETRKIWECIKIAKTIMMLRLMAIEKI